MEWKIGKSVNEGHPAAQAKEQEAWVAPETGADEQASPAGEHRRDQRRPDQAELRQFLRVVVVGVLPIELAMVLLELCADHGVLFLECRKTIAE